MLLASWRRPIHSTSSQSNASQSNASQKPSQSPLALPPQPASDASEESVVQHQTHYPLLSPDRIKLQARSIKIGFNSQVRKSAEIAKSYLAV